MEKKISKSKYCKGVQCPKILWLDEHKPELGNELDNESVLENGKLVGQLAREYFGDYSLVPFNYDFSMMINDTKQLLNAGCGCIAEASFMFDGLFCSVDILRKNQSGYDIIEVKSSTKTEDIHLDDVSYQYYVLFKSEIPINKVYVMYINNQYIRQGELDLRELFVMEDVTDEVIKRQSFVEKNIKDIQEYLLNEAEPERDIDVYCDEPYHCAYYGYCSRHLPSQSVFDIKGLYKNKKFQLYHDGILSFEDIISNRVKLSEKQMKQVETTYYHKPAHIDSEKIRGFLNTLSYPVYHLDFETYQTPIPEYDGMRPYEQIPFQYSLHIENENGDLEHKEFLAKEGTDPRRELSERLISDIPENACVLAYNMSFEKSVIKRLAEHFCDLSEHLLNIRDNIQDLMIPFKEQYYYTEAMQGSYSIKYVLPALFPNDPELDYHNLEGIHHGGEASAAFANMTKLSPEEIERTRINLLKYCGLDTYGMVKVLVKLRGVAYE